MKLHHFPYALLIVLAILLLSAPVLAEEENPWTRPTCVFGMPNAGRAVQRDQKGLITELLRAVYQREGVIFRHEEMPYERAIQRLAQGKIQCTLDVIGKQKGFIQAKNTIVLYDLSAAYRRTTPWKDVTSLKDKKVAYLHGFDIRHFLPVKVIPQLVYDLSSAYHLLDRNFADYILDDNVLLRNALRESHLPPEEYDVSLIKTFEVRPIFANNKEGRRFSDIYDRRILEMMETGEYIEIAKKYGMSDQKIKRIYKANGRQPR